MMENYSKRAVPLQTDELAPDIKRWIDTPLNYEDKGHGENALKAEIR